MRRYLISFDAHAMDHIPDEDMPAVAMPRSRWSGGHQRRLWVFGGGLETRR